MYFLSATFERIGSNEEPLHKSLHNFYQSTSKREEGKTRESQYVIDIQFKKQSHIWCLKMFLPF